MTLLQLNYFQAVAHNLSFRKASETLHISQSTISTSIANLEGELGFLLFQRIRKHIELTKYGHYYLKKITPILGSLINVTKDVQKLADARTGNIDIAYDYPFSQGFVPDSAHSFMISSPNNSDVKFQFTQMDSCQIIQGILSENYDIGYTTATVEDPDIEFYPILHCELTAIVPCNHKFAKRNSLRIEEFIDLPYVSYHPDSILYNMITERMQLSGICPHVVATAFSEEAIASLVGADFGVSIVAKTDFLNSASNIKQIPLENSCCILTLYMAHSKKRFLTLPVQRFIEYIKTNNCLT